MKSDVVPYGCRRPTDAELKAAAQRHVAYGWVRSPGTHQRNVYWTSEDAATYNRYYDEAKHETH